ncbi:NAD-dependent epimerase/dehydratase family protein [Ekhidna sp.]|uniref:NAD-dependent epimerase/dehydratase family protein n=1 Tax=Ekhidna sp. TaxID=2608089 RepID=UPI003CCBE347
MSDRKAVVIGATGLIGTQLVRLMVKDDRYHTITIITRRPFEINDPKLVELRIKDFGELGNYSSNMDGHDFYCALGTTRKKAGSKEAFLKVDVEYPLAFAEIAKKQKNFQQLLVVSALGANSSSFLLYNKAKGELEDRLQELKLRSLKIFQPSLLLGDRKEFRLFEEVAKTISKIASFFVPGSKKIGAICDEEVATAMIELAHKNESGFKRFKPKEMIEIAHSA